MSTLVNYNEWDPLKKPVNTLAIVPQSRKITVLGRKAYNVMLSIAQNQGIEKEGYRAPLTEIVSGIDYSSNDSELIKKHLRSMASTLVEWNSPTTGEGANWTVCTLIAYARIIKTGGQNWVEWDYALPLKQELLEPSVFAKLPLGMLSQMHTHAGIALYEICTRYKVIGRTSRQNWRWWLPVLTGHPNSEKLAKTEYRFFKRDSIKPAIAEVCSITDIEIELVEYKDGKSISDLQFLVRPKAQVQLPLKTPPKPVDLAIIKKAVDLGISDDKAEELAVQFGEAAILEGLTALEGRVATSFPEPIRDSYRYLKAMLSGEQSKQVAAQITNEKTPQALDLGNKKRQVELRTAWSDEWLKRQRAKVTEMLLEQSDEAIAGLTTALMESMIQSNAHPSLLKRLQTGGWNHPLVKHLMIDFYAKAALGDDWDKASSEALLDIASEVTIKGN
jgi:hypothetical protein